MSFYAKIKAHSVTEWGAEAITMEVQFPRIILAEFLTHREFARNTSSSRAIPISKLLRDVSWDMFTPVWWGANQKGMQAEQELSGLRLTLAKIVWGLAGHLAINAARVLSIIGLHKQITNRVIENFGWVRMVFTTSSLTNFISLRMHKDAQPEIRYLAELIYQQYQSSIPKLLGEGEWHLPYISSDDRTRYEIDDLIKISVARCASISYRTVDGREMTPIRAIALYDKLVGSQPIHASPTEHQLTPDRMIKIDVREHGKRKFTTKAVWENPELHGNTNGFIQLRKTLPGEYANQIPET